MQTDLIKRTAPCSYLEIEKFQSWLEDLSMQGYLLSRRAGTRHNYLFHRISPLATRYRLTPVSDNLEDWNERPDTEKQTLSEAFGWEYVCTVDGFHIYRSYSDEDRELNSDPEVLAESLRLLKRKALFSALAVVIAPAVFLLLLAFLIVEALYEYLTGTYNGFSVSEVRTSVNNHHLVFAAEQSRMNNTVVDLEEYVKSLNV